MEDALNILKTISLLLIAIACMVISCFLEEINNNLNQNCITVEDKVYCEKVNK